MSSGARDGVGSTSRPREEGNESDQDDSARGRRRVTYSREFLLAVGGSEACRGDKQLPAGFDANAVSLLGLWCGRMLSLGDQLGPGEASNGKGAAWKWVPRSATSRGGGHGHGAAESSSERAREPGSFQTGARTKGKPCTKFFSTAGCCYGEKCRFIHNFPGGYQAPADPPRSISLGPAVPDGPLTPTYEREIGKHMSKDNSVPPLREQRLTDHCTPQQAPTPGMASAASFGASATATISVDASLKGVIIGWGGVNIKQVSRDSGAKVWIRDHESDTNLKYVELQGTFDQIKNASSMVMELIGIGGGDPSLSKDPAAGGSHRGGGPGSSFKTKLCGYFARGLCAHGDGCRFAHGVSELRKMVVSPRDPSGGW